LFPIGFVSFSSNLLGYENIDLVSNNSTYKSELMFISQTDQKSAVTDPMILYPNGIEFDVYRKGKRVGSHTVVFKRERETLKVISTFRLRVKLMFIVGYKYDFESIGYWRDGNLYQLDSNTNDNGKKFEVRATVDENGIFHSIGKKGSFSSNNIVFPTSHWNSSAVDQNLILNTINGQIAKIKVLNRGVQKIQTVTNSIDAELFEYTGELKDTNVWYDKNGRWVKMIFTTKKGETLSYVCRECGLSDSIVKVDS